MQGRFIQAGFANSLRECPDCGLLNDLPRQAEAGTVIQCGRCAMVFRRVRHRSMEKVLCFALAGMIFYVLLAACPMLDVSLFGRWRTNTLRSGPIAFDNAQLWMLGALVVLTTIAMPLVKIVLTLTVLLGLRMEEPPRILVDCFRWAKEVTKWSMLEVYLLGFLVAYTRLQSLVHIHIDIAVYALVGTILAQVSMDAVLDSEVVWQEMDRKGITEERPQDTSLPLIGCHMCHMASHARPNTPCPRCGAHLHRRKRGSLTRTWALALSAIIFYIPANMFPVMIVTRAGKTGGHTIIDGLIEFAQAGLWPLALLIFIASIAIPMLKLLVLFFIMVQTHRQSDKSLLLRTRLYRMVDFIGRWSMVDIFMLSILVGLVQYGQIVEIRPGLGAPCFAAVVVLTMLAVEGLDPRLMWDAGRRSGSKRVQPDATTLTA